MGPRNSVNAEPADKRTRAILPNGRRIETDAPCLILVAADATRVVDPTQKLKKLHLKIDDRERKVTLPAGALAGTASVL